MFTRFHRSWEPTFHEDRLHEPYRLDMRRKQDNPKIFVCSCSDLFAPWTPAEWRDEVLQVVCDPGLKWITFQLLTKNPELIPKTRFPDNVWVGMTITRQQEADTKMVEAANIDAKVRFVSFEPLLEHIDPEPWIENFEWVIVGKLTGCGKIPLDAKWVQTLIDSARENQIPIFVKNNVGWSQKIQEFPDSR
jgi:protein gp37